MHEFGARLGTCFMLPKAVRRTTKPPGLLSLLAAHVCAWNVGGVPEASESDVSARP
jgi:hypothetical protein